MLNQQKLILSLAIVLFAAPAGADPVAYVVTTNQQLGIYQFGTVDLATGGFRPIGHDEPAIEELVPAPNGSLLTFDFSGNLDSINPANGVLTVIGPTGLENTWNALGEIGGKLYATDLANNFYTVNPATGSTHRIGATGIPAVPFIPGSTNPDGTINISNETLFGAAGKLYATFDADKFDPRIPAITPVIAPNLYQIDPTKGTATLVDPTTLLITASVDLNGTVYSLVGNAEATAHAVTLDVTNGKTTLVTNVDTAAGLIWGATPVPEPASITLLCAGMLFAMVCAWRKWRSA